VTLSDDTASESSANDAPPPNGDGGRSRSPRETGALVIVLVVAAALRLWDLGGHSIWLDEANSLLDSRDLGHALTRDYHPPLHYVVTWLSLSLFGENALALRLPSAIAGIATVAVAWAFARRALASPRQALVFAALLALMPALIWHARDGRMYAPLALFVWGALWAAWQIDDEGVTGKRARLVYWLCTAGAALTHHYAVFYALGAAALAWLRLGDHPLRKSRADLRRLLLWHAPHLLVFPGVLTLIAVDKRDASELMAYLVDKVRGSSGHDNLFNGVAHLISYENWVFRVHGSDVFDLYGVLVLLAIVIGGARLAMKRADGRRYAALLAAFLIPYAVIELLPIRAYSRLLLPTAPWLALFFAMAIAPAATASAGRRLVGGLVAVFFALAIGGPLLDAYRLEVEPWNAVCESIAAKEKPDEVIVITPGYMRKPLSMCWRGKARIEPLPGSKPGRALGDAPRVVGGASGVWAIYARRAKSDPDGIILNSLAPLYADLERGSPGPEIRVFHFTGRRSAAAETHP
jgi:4-amino-4-deoxy-L-arabinose transferase-like glycosyltransferase